MSEIIYVKLNRHLEYKLAAHNNIFFVKNPLKLTEKNLWNKTTLQIPSTYSFPAQIRDDLGRRTKKKLTPRSSNSKSIAAEKGNMGNLRLQLIYPRKITTNFKNTNIRIFYKTINSIIKKVHDVKNAMH